MSARKSWTIWCDGCGESDGGDLSAETAQERREDLRHEGWRVNLPGGKDLCPDCPTERPASERPHG